MIRPVVANNHVLRSVRLLLEAYAGAPLPEWDAFARTIRGFHLDAGDVLFAAREVHPFLYFVNEGLFKAEMVNVRGRPVVTFFADEGELLVSMPALAPQGVRRVAQRNLHPRTSDLAPAVEGVSIHTRSVSGWMASSHSAVSRVSRIQVTRRPRRSSHRRMRSSVPM